MTETQRIEPFHPAARLYLHEHGEGWTANAGASKCILARRMGVTRNNRKPFTAEGNLTACCEHSAEVDSIASRFGEPRDPATGLARDGTITVVAPHTVKLSMPDITIIAPLTDFPAVIRRRSDASGDPAAHPVGTGPWLAEVNETGVMQVPVHSTEPVWWRAAVIGGSGIVADGGEPHDQPDRAGTCAAAAGRT